MMSVDRREELSDLQYMHLGVLEGYSVYATPSTVMTPYNGKKVPTIVMCVAKPHEGYPSYLLFYGTKELAFLKPKEGENPLKNKSFVRNLYQHFISDVVRKFFPDFDLDEKITRGKLPTPSH
ncbi:hypothetical protein A2935_03805 [Candidatus Wolfebacteria bacterium RIFCSPLOWO2_01_FULL_47_17b]|uniref:Uncharacterized protein n=1 Tax=Candidatus Wolfebacteria bacterium RIFCSPLOWO2_01_FULL_47_17b TaxID=1802558 RepID=A0A1F8DWY0_9BACT|nr:MAG: hypothetical protein A2935_03805 [Candidatus Wolfebacteria bacterium RIFCSPLOWO2_01_FULL_47_17b]